MTARLPFGVTHQQMARRLHDAAALVRVDAFDGRAQCAAAACANFDDDELAVVAADEVELAEAAAIAAREDREPVPLEVARRRATPRVGRARAAFNARR